MRARTLPLFLCLALGAGVLWLAQRGPRNERAAPQQAAPSAEPARAAAPVSTTLELRGP